MLKWITNHHPDERNVIIEFGQSREEAVRHQREWLRDKVIGEPQGTEHYTVEKLKAMGLVGVYVEEGESNG
jgi:hypothetical protein